MLSHEGLASVLDLGGLFHLAHFAAALGTTAAYFRATFHVLAANSLAGLGAGFTNIRASSTNGCVKRRLPGHEIRSCLANLNAIRHEFDMLRLQMLAAFIKAMGKKCFLTFVPTLPTGCNAVMVVHGRSPN